MSDSIKVISPEAWTALATWVLVAGTLLAVWWQAREQRTIHAFDLNMKLAGQFESFELKKHRKQLATMLIAKNMPDAPNESSQQVLSLFDTVGLLVSQRMLHKILAWHEFGFVVLHYHEALADRLRWVRKEFGDETIHADFDELFGTLLEVERKARHISREAARPTASNVHQFLLQEKELVIENTTALPGKSAVSGQ